jgi:hypothetical protein
MRITLRSLVMASVALAAATFTAQAAHAATTINVPFAFAVGDKVCPAGQYTVRTDDLGSSVELIGASNGFKWMVHPGDPAPTDRRVILKFATAGNTHVLQSVQFGPMVTSRIDTRDSRIETAQTGTGTTAGR